MEPSASVLKWGLDLLTPLEQIDFAKHNHVGYFNTSSWKHHGFCLAIYLGSLIVEEANSHVLGTLSQPWEETPVKKY